MRLIATTVIREAHVGKQDLGFIYDVDWDAGAVVRRLRVPEPSFPRSDDNPRGGVRGGRGVAVTSQGILVANYDGIYVFDDDWRPLDVIESPLFVGLHEIHWDGTQLWITATALDVVLKMRLGEPPELAWDAHDRTVARKVGVRRLQRALDGTVDYRVEGAQKVDECHVNSAVPHGDALIINCGVVHRTSSPLDRAERRFHKFARRRPPLDKLPVRKPRRFVVSLHADGRVERIAELGDHWMPSHNGQSSNGRVLVNDSPGKALRVFSGKDPAETRDIPLPGRWHRGLAVVGPDSAVVGAAPASLALVDLVSGTVERRLQLSEDPNEAVHGLVVCPEPAERR
jgi:hypothetical protein